jgi:hypothetical protein
MGILLRNISRIFVSRFHGAEKPDKEFLWVNKNAGAASLSSSDRANSTSFSNSDHDQSTRRKRILGAVAVFWHE